MGGVNGRKLRLIALDDGYEPARTAPNMRQLIEKDNVLAIIGNVGTPTAVVAVPLANEEKTLLFAPFAGGPNLRNNPPDRYVINFRAGYAEETNSDDRCPHRYRRLETGGDCFLHSTDNSGFAMGQRH